MKVSVSGRQFAFPRSCACCGAYPLTTMTVSGTEKNRMARTRGWTWDIPYCMPCKGHVRAAERLAVLGLLLAAGSFIAAFAVGIVSGEWSLGLETLLLLLGAVALTGWAVVRTLRRSRPSSCCGLTRAVSYLGSSGTCHSFEFSSGFYAAEFVRSNYRKLVNASPRVASIVRNTKFNDYQVPRRLLRRRG